MVRKLLLFRQAITLPPSFGEDYFDGAKRMPEAAEPVRYVLYSHYAYQESADFASYSADKNPSRWKGLNTLLNYSRGLKELLTAPGHEGLLVLFYAPGYERYLQMLASATGLKGSQPVALTPEMAFAQSAACYVRRKLKARGLAGRVRFLTWKDLSIILGRANEILASNFIKYFIGNQPGIKYDVPKVVEAILRLRLLGNGVPVLRVDHDVLFRNTNQNIGDLGMFKAIACSARAYQLRLAEPSVSTFLFSASYNSREILHPTRDTVPFDAWSGAFATRIYPALLVEAAQIRAISSEPVEEARNERWKKYTRTTFREPLVRRFLGITSGRRNLKVDYHPFEHDWDDLEDLRAALGLRGIGAHPLHSVISGALLCLSDGAILDLPPFSNIHTNVMWIDDHLKYSLHRAMNHFTSGETLNLGRGLSDARMDDVTVTKERPSIRDLPTYVLGSYLPTLFLGTIMDAWITPHPILKERFAGLGPKGRIRWRDATETQNTAPLPDALLRSSRVGQFRPTDETALEEQLTRSAVTRIETTRQIWASLESDGKPTFASFWAKGQVNQPPFGEIFGKMFLDAKSDLWQGISPGRPLNRPIARLADAGQPINDAVRDLIRDTLNYVHLSLEWPKFVQIVRSIRQGEFPGDLSWPTHRSAP